ncbi:hypothetical protein THRCLA_22925 [Thraustotheca clavata]|uniref:PRA1 family protein n=1 Tax=Thraustotheca clavata TaxID=74557 RepID=A0A1V9YN82_9STRA|nr:hypothetical protein THRCLA_22925 [Thraustotheca clavata]
MLYEDNHNLSEPTVEINPLSLIAYDNIRDLQTFVGLGDLLSRPYTLPNSSGELSRRFQRNVLYFIANYAMVFDFFLFVHSLTAPIFLCILMLSTAAWFYMDKLASEEAQRQSPTYIFGIPTTTEQRSTILIISSFILSIIYGGSVLLYALSSSLFVCGAHACLRNAKLPTDEEMIHLLHTRSSNEGNTQPNPNDQQSYMVV